MGEGENRPSLQYCEALVSNNSVGVWHRGVNLRKPDEMSGFLHADEIFDIDHHWVIGESVGLWARVFDIAAQSMTEPLVRPDAGLRKPQEDSDNWYEEGKNLQCG